MKKIKRLIKHIFATKLLIYKYLSKKDIESLENMISLSEKKHQGEIRIVIQAHLTIHEILKNISIKQRAIDLFSLLRIWDTEENNGILIYLLLADKKIQILADRGIYHIKGQKYWDSITKETTEYFKKEAYLEGLSEIINKITGEMVKMFPAKETNENELPNKIVIL